MNSILRKIHRYWFLSAISMTYFVYYPFLKFAVRNPQKNYDLICRYRRRIALTGSFLAGIRFKTSFETPVSWDQPYILCANHTSFIDIAILTYLCPTGFSFIGKEELSTNFFTRLFFNTVDIPVKRENKISSYRAFKKAHQMLENNKSVAMFPEGKIDDEFPPRLHPFKSGAFRLAEDNDIPILPIVIENAWTHFFDDGSKYGTSPGIIRINVLNPVSSSDILQKDSHELQHHIFNRMEKYWLANHNK